MFWLQASEFDWSPELRGAILSSFFYGYISTQLIGGLLGAKIGGVKLIGYGVLCTAFLTILTPMAARYSVYLVIVLRVIEGVFEVWHINIYDERDSLYLLNTTYAILKPKLVVPRESYILVYMPYGRDGRRPPNAPDWDRSLFPAVLWARFSDTRCAVG